MVKCSLNVLFTVVVFLAAGVAGPSAASDSAAPAPGSAEAPVDTLLARGWRALEGDDVDVAEGLFREALERSEDCHRAEHGLAEVSLRRDDPDAAIKHARNALRGDDGNSDYHLALAYGYGIKAMRGGLSSMFYAGKFKMECEEAVELDPGNVDAHFGLLQYYLNAPGLLGGGEDKAEETVATIAELDPYEGEMARAYLAWDGGDLREVERRYLAAAALDTSRLDAWVALGMLYMQLERHEEAIPVGERVLRLDPDNYGAIYQLARAHLLLGDDLNAAERGFTAYIEAGEHPRGYPGKAAAYWRLGMVHERAGRLDEARASWEAALELDPEQEQANARLDSLRETHPELWQRRARKGREDDPEE